MSQTREAPFISKAEWEQERRFDAQQEIKNAREFVQDLKTTLAEEPHDPRDIPWSH